MDDIIIGGSSAAIVIVMAIQIAKSYGMDSKYAPLVAAGLGVLASLLVAMDENGGNTSYWVNVAIRGFMYGLSAIGFQSASAALQREADKKQLVNTAQQDQTETTATVVANPQGVTTEVEIEPVDTPTPPPTVAGGTPVGRPGL